MSIFRRNLLKMGGGRMIDVTDRFEKIEKSYTNPSASDIGSKVQIREDRAHDMLVIPRQKGLFADVSKYMETSNWPIGMISYVDDDDILIKGDAVCSYYENRNQVIYGQYNRFELIFPDKATKAYVSSCIDTADRKSFPPKVYKKIM